VAREQGGRKPGYVVLTRIGLLMATFIFAALGAGAAIGADDVLCPDGSIPDADTGVCRGETSDDGDSGRQPDGDPGKDEFVENRVCAYQNEQHPKAKIVPCVGPSGVWSNYYDCYVGSPSDPQPPKSDEEWKGHTDGAIYACYRRWNGHPSPDGPGALQRVWLREPPVDLEQLARHAVDEMNLRAIEIGLSVPDLPDRMIYTGAPVWMWTADPSPATTGPNRLSASAGGVTVTARARLASITWSMGDGRRVVCTGERRARGTVYKPRYGMAESPTCGYRYKHPAAKVGIAAASHWVVDWAGSGQSGTFEFDLTRRTTRPVGEIQVLIRTGKH
jgi:hypothetical protein